nr:hypothetical protein [Pseudomonas sp. BSw22131]
MNQRDRFLQIAKKRRGQVVIVAGTDEEDFRAITRGAGATAQLSGKAPIAGLCGPTAQQWAQLQQIQPRRTTVSQTVLDRRLLRQAVVQIENVQGCFHPSNVAQDTGFMGMSTGRAALEGALQRVSHEVEPRLNKRKCCGFGRRLPAKGSVSVGRFFIRPTVFSGTPQTVRG